MNDLQELALKHKIENDLYHGGGFQRVYDVIGNVYRDKFIRACTEVTFTEKKEKWVKLVEFLKAELRVQEEILLVGLRSLCAKAAVFSRRCCRPSRGHSTKNAFRGCPVMFG